MGRGELLRLLGQLSAVDHFEADRFIAGERLSILRRAEESAARELAEKVRALGGIVSVEPSPPEFALPSDMSLVSLDGDDQLPAPMLTTTPEPAVPVAAPEPAPVARAPARDAFSAPPVDAAPMELERPQPKAPPPPPVDEERPAPLAEEEPEPEPELVPGRLFQGKLRRQPMARLFAGIALGLTFGYLLAMPYADRAERRVAQIRAAANVERYRPVDEARANTARLDQQADDAASSAFVTTLIIWLSAAGAITAGWFRLT